MPPSKCEFILINGKNKGKPCNKKYCKNHKQKQIEEIIVEKNEDSEESEDSNSEDYIESYEERENDIRKIEKHINTDFNEIVKQKCESMGLVLNDDEKDKLIKSLIKLI